MKFSVKFLTAVTALTAVAGVAVRGGVAMAQPRPQPAPPPAPAPSGPPVTTQPVDPMAPAANPPGGEVLTLERAIEIAMRQQPSLRQSQAQLEAARGRVDLARVARNPTLAADATAGTGSTIQRGTIGAGGAAAGSTGPDFFSHAESTGLGATASWRIYDFGQTSANIHAAEANADAFAATIGTTTLDIRTNVEVAYLTAVADRKLELVAQATVKSEDGHLDQARRFVAAQAQDRKSVV